MQPQYPMAPQASQQWMTNPNPYQMQYPSAPQQQQYLPNGMSGGGYPGYQGPNPYAMYGQQPQQQMPYPGYGFGGGAAGNPMQMRQRYAGAPRSGQEAGNLEKKELVKTSQNVPAHIIIESANNGFETPFMGAIYNRMMSDMNSRIWLNDEYNQ